MIGDSFSGKPSNSSSSQKSKEVEEGFLGGVWVGDGSDLESGSGEGSGSGRVD